MIRASLAGMITRLLVGAGLLAASALGASAQAPGPPPAPSEAAKALVGVWELSNPDRDRRCQLTFKLDPAAPGRAIALAGNCATAFPDLKAVGAWTMGSDDALKLVDPKGAVLLELTEVESGMYETTPSYTHYFLQTLAASGKDRIPDDLFGDWAFTRGSARQICGLTLGNTAYDTDSFALVLKPGCDPLIARFAPVAWKLDRSQFVMLSAKGEAWRFEENEPNAWSRIPAMRPPLVLVKP
jgi:hypothetical protein